jgi:hypothetical protein
MNATPKRRNRKRAKKSIPHVVAVPAVPIDETWAAQRRAYKVVGADQVSRLGWLIEFSWRTPDQIRALSDSDLVNLDAEVATFARGKPRRGFGHAMRSPGWIGGMRDELCKLATFTKRKVADFMTGEVVIRPSEFGRFAHCFNRSLGQDWYEGDRGAIFAEELRLAIKAEGQRIQLCASAPCARPFVKRKRGEFCSSRCSRRERMRRYRKNLSPEDRYLDRHARYIKSVPRGHIVNPRGPQSRFPED